MRASNDRSEFIKTLREAPFISYAARKVGISRSTIYRWLKDYQRFKKEVDIVLDDGRKQLTDNAEMALLNKIKKGDMRAIIFFLTHNDPRYIPKRTTYVEPIVKLKPGEICERCGQENYLSMTGEERKYDIIKGLDIFGMSKEEKERVINNIFPDLNEKNPNSPDFHEDN